MTETQFFNSNDRPSRQLRSGSTSTPERSEEDTAAFEAVMQSDRDFFLAHPERDWYVRSITPIELTEGQSMGKPIGADAMVLVGEVAPGSRIRLTFWGDELPPVEEFKTVQRQMRKEMGVKSVGIKDRLKQSGKGHPKAKGFG